MMQQKVKTVKRLDSSLLRACKIGLIDELKYEAIKKSGFAVISVSNQAKTETKKVHQWGISPETHFWNHKFIAEVETDAKERYYTISRDELKKLL